MTTKCNTVSWLEFRNRKGILKKNVLKIEKKIWTLGNSNYDKCTILIKDNDRKDWIRIIW